MSVLLKTIFTQEQNEFMRMNYSTMSYHEIAEKLGFTERQVRGRINNMGLSKLRKFDKKFFKEINTASKAYWLGFIYADGCVIHNKVRRNYELNLDIQHQDSYLLEELNKELGGVHTVTFRKRGQSFNGYTYTSHGAILRILSKEIVEDLINHNVLPNKTLQSDFPKCQNFFWDFLRGFNVGDGCLYVNSKSLLMYEQLTNANRNFLEYLENEIYARLRIRGSVYKENDRKFRLVYFRKQDTKLLLDEIYKDENCVKLSRKFSIYKSHYWPSQLEIAG